MRASQKPSHGAHREADRAADSPGDLVSQQDSEVRCDDGAGHSTHGSSGTDSEDFPDAMVRAYRRTFDS